MGVHGEGSSGVGEKKARPDIIRGEPKGVGQPGQTDESAPPSTSMILPVTQAEAGLAR